MTSITQTFDALIIKWNDIGVRKKDDLKMLRKAFLAHSSKDKDLVRAVASELDLHDCVFDENVFETGVGFGEAIKKGLDDSLIFVFFASQNSLQNVSEWIALEQSEAQARIDSGQIKRALVFLVDKNTTPDKLPNWMQQARAVLQTAPKLIASDIRHHIDALVEDDQRPVFFGRGQALDDAQKVLFAPGRERRVFLIYGIRGIGKRSFCRQLAENLLTLPTLCEIRIEEGDDLADIAIKLADATSVVLTRADLDRFTAQVRLASRQDLLQQIRDAFRKLLDGRQLPVFFDDGGLLDNDGNLTDAVSQILTIVNKQNRLYLALITSRRPTEAEAVPNELPAIRVDSLKQNDIEQILQVLCDRANIGIDPNALGKVAHAIKGYPPAALYAVELIARDGLALILEADAELVAFRSGLFLRALERDTLLTPARKQTLRALAEYEVLPLESIKAQTRLEKNELWEQMRYLLDCAFIIPQGNDLYRIAEPLIEAVARIFRDERIAHADVQRGLQKYIDGRDESDIPLDVRRNLWRAAVGSGDEDQQRIGYYLASDLIKLLKQSFHRKQYEKAITLGQVAIESRPDSVQARSYYIRALIQSERYDEALSELESLRVRRQLREYYYLLGYLEQKRDRFRESIDAFLDAIHHGRDDATIHRELAESCLYIDDLSRALHHSSIALRKEPENKFIIDLYIRVQTKRGDLDEARGALGTLRLLDDSPYYLHRKSVVEYAGGNAIGALASERDALTNCRHASSQMLAQLIICELAVGDIHSAQRHVEELGRTKQKVNRDILISLRARIEVARERFEDALLILDGLRDRNRPVQLAIRHQALDGFIRQLEGNDPRVSGLSEQLDTIARQLEGSNSRFIDVDAIGYGLR